MGCVGLVLGQPDSFSGLPFDEGEGGAEKPIKRGEKWCEPPE